MCAQEIKALHFNFTMTQQTNDEKKKNTEVSRTFNSYCHTTPIEKFSKKNAVCIENSAKKKLKWSS